MEEYINKDNLRCCCVSDLYAMRKCVYDGTFDGFDDNGKKMVDKNELLFAINEVIVERILEIIT